MIHNLKTNKEIKQVTLDLDDSEDSRERARDLFIISQDAQTLILRSDDSKGVKIISLEDGNIKSEVEKLHQKPISKMILMNDQ